MKNKKDVFIMGTRPEIIKMAPIILKIDQSERIILHTGQHKELAEEAFKTFGISPDIELDLMTENQDVMLFVSKCLESISNLQLTADDISRIWVQGDTATAFAGALTGKFLKIPVVHVEAGLRTYDMLNPWPEEMFRTEIDNISDILLAPTETSKRNLKNISSEKI
ncbi:TPA: UDP-N-acetylglucosamine 2-epimerase (non-hydrolyzing), partial [Candidatus Woesebacteria bacterium]|nr:UDP-N-acetylglucosamine 2-epimerase (non-hydrolyzing) [Candidatus Woesebacteria bacterium]